MDNSGNNGGNAGADAVVPPAVGSVDPAVNPLSGLEDAIAATKAAAQTTETPAASPTDQFNVQFGSGTTPPAPAVDTTAPTTQPDLGVSPVAEAVAQPEQNPAEELKQKISDDVDTFLAEEVKEKPAA